MRGIPARRVDQFNVQSVIARDGVVLESVSKVELAWLAGFFDGEGHISMRMCGTNVKKPGAKTYHALHMVLAQKHPEVLHSVQRRFGGRLYGASDVKQAFRLYWYNREAAVLFRLLYPYLRVKRVQGMAATLKFYVTRSNKRSWPPRRTANRRGASRLRKDHHALPTDGGE